MTSSIPAKLLNLPLELRLHIYEFCEPSGCITIGALDRIEAAEGFAIAGLSNDDAPIAGLALGKTAVLKDGFHRALLEETPSNVRTNFDGQDHSHELETSKRGALCADDISAGAVTLPNGKRRKVESPHSTTGSGSSRRSSSSTTETRRSSASQSSLDGKYWVTNSAGRTRSSQNLTAASKQVADVYTEPEYPYHYLPHQALHLVCRQIHHELSAHSKYTPAEPPQPRQLDLYLSYPSGVSIAATRYKNLLRVARTVHVSGVWDLRVRDPHLIHPSAQRRIENEEPVSKRPDGYNGTADLEIDQINALEHLTHIILGRTTVKAAEQTHNKQHPNFVFPEGRASPPPEEDAALKARAAAYAPVLELRIWHPESPKDHPYRELVQQGKGKFTSLNWDVWQSRHTRQGLTKETAIDLTRSDTSPVPSTTPMPMSTAQETPITHHSVRPPPRRSPPRQENTYSLLWTHTLSPGPAALQCIYGGDLKMAVARHVTGNALRLTGKCNFARGRYLSMSWPKLEETEGGVRGWLIPEEWGK